MAVTTELIRVEFSESVSGGVAGYQECGLTGKTGATETGLSTTTQYYFKINDDGNGVTEYDITTVGDTTFTAVIALMNAETSGVCTFSLEDGNLRCTSDTTGASSSIALSAGTTGTDLFATLTDFSSFDTAVVGVNTNSSIVELTDDVTTIVISVVFNNASTAKIQTTTNTREEIEAETATWFDWSYGEISSNSQKVASAPNAIKLVNIGSGEISWSIRANR